MKPINHRWKVSAVSFYFFVIVPCVLLQITASGANAATGFGSGGIVTTAIGVSDAGVNALVIQSDEKLVAAGFGYTMLGQSTRFVITRYNTDGSLDTAFGTGGIVTTAVGVAYAQANALAIQSDGKLVAAGYAHNGSQYVFALVRYNTDGSLDTTFGTGGIVTTAVGVVYAQANALAIQSGGKLVAAGYAEIGPPGLSAPGFALVRYNTNGSLDTTFGTGGIVTTALGGIAYAVAIQSDGKVIAAGGTQQQFALARYNTDGSLDSTFGTGGIVMASGAGLFYGAKALIIQSNGKLVAAGAATEYATGERVFVLIRYNADGSLDTTFGTGGIVITDVGSSGSEANALTIQSDGKVVAAGYSDNDHGNQFALVRYNTNGSLDTTFGTGGIATTSIRTPPLNDEAKALAIQPDGKLVAAGFSANGDSGPSIFSLVRYDTDGSLDTTSTNTTTTTTSTTTTTTTTTTRTTTTTIKCNDHNKDKDRGKGHDKGRGKDKCKGHSHHGNGKD